MKIRKSVAHVAVVAGTLLSILVGTVLASGSSEAVIWNFSAAFANPMNGLVADSAGNLYGTTVDGTVSPYGAVFELSPNSDNGWTETTLINFNGKNGNIPESTMLVDSLGNVYGSTVEGGSGKCTGFGGTVVGCGVVFELTPELGGPWKYAALYSFTGGGDGTSPVGNLIMDSAGNLYGMTGPAATGSAANGTVWELKRPIQKGGQWLQSVLHTFNGTDGFGPNSLILKEGALYGTTGEGGSANYTGTVFKLTPTNGTWAFNMLYAFLNGADGGFPASVIGSATSGALYGNTSQGGQYNWGTVFKLTPNLDGTWTESVVYSFAGGADGATPESPLIRDKRDNLFGTTDSGGLTTECSFSYPYDGCGVVFEVVPSTGVEIVLHTFTDAPSDGYVSFASGVVFGKGHALFGTTELGGTGGDCMFYDDTCGTVYKVTP